MNRPAGRRLAARAWRVVAAVVAGLLILAALALGALRLAIARVPDNAARIQAWVEQQTDLRIEYGSLDARLRWFGPEIVLRDVRILERDGSEALLVAREGSVGLDLLSLFQTGELVAGRVRFAGPTLTLVRLADGSIRLLGQNQRPLDRPPFDLDRLPAGWLVVADATVTYRDLASESAALTFTDIQLDLRRERDGTAVTGSARLPATLGRRIDFRGDLHGSLEKFAALDAQLELRVDRIVLPGLAPLLPASIARPLAGSGRVQGQVQFKQGTLAHARLALELADVGLALPRRDVPAVPTLSLSAPLRTPGASPMTLPLVISTVVQRPGAAVPATVRYPRLGGTVRLRHDGPDWLLRAQDLDFGAVAGRTAAPASMDLRWRGNARTTFSTTVSAENLRLAEAWPLVLAFAPPAFDAWAGLAPRGEVRSLRAEITRDRAGAFPTFTLAADVTGLGFAAIGRHPGLSGLTGVVSGTDQNGRIALRSTSLAFDLPGIFRAPISDVAASGDLEWRREGAQWVLASGPVSIEQPHARASGRFEFRYERAGVSPLLAMDIKVLGADVAFAGDVMPYGAFGSGAVSWLAPAFLGGRVESGQVSYRGPIGSFPFRNGEGDFLATAVLRDVAVDYFTGFEPLRGGRGKVEFHNAGFVAQLDGGNIGGLRLDHAEVGIADMHTAVVEVAARASGDLGVALPFAQKSPVGSLLGGQFMGLSGSGPAEFNVRLHLPTDPSAAHDFVIGTSLRSATVHLPALNAPVERVTGLFEIHNLDMRARALRGTMLGGPFELDVEPGRLTPQTDALVLLHGRGRALGAGLPAFIGLPQSIRMSGGADWKLEGRIERQRGTDLWSSRYDVTSNLAGLGIAAPQPFAKAAPAPRPTRVGLDFSPRGLGEIAVESGPARLRLQLGAGEDGHVKLERGIARFDGRPAVLPQGTGLHLTGDWPEFDLGEWLALGTGGGPGDLSKWLGPTAVRVEKARIFGFEFSQVDASLKADPGSLEVRVSGPMAQGLVTIPDDLDGGRPIRFDMERLVLQQAAAQGAADPNPVDPRDLPALSFDVADFRWQQRRFGRLVASVVKEPRGLRLDQLEATTPDTGIAVQGDWLKTDTGSRTQLTIGVTSTNLGRTSGDLDLPGSIEAKHAKATASLTWPGGPMGDIVAHLDGTGEIALERGQLRSVKPGAGRMLGLASLAELPRRLALDFHDVTDAGLAFDSVHGDFEIRDGNAYTQNLLLKGAALDIGIVGRTGLAAEDYDQTIVVSGNPTGAATVAGALALGPIGAAGGLLLSQIFKGQLKGLVRVYYRVTGPWADPVVERISSQEGEEQTSSASAAAVGQAAATDQAPGTAPDPARAGQQDAEQ